MNNKFNNIIFQLVCLAQIYFVLAGCSDAANNSTRTSKDLLPPEIKLTTPLNGTLDYSVRGEISVEFSAPKQWTPLIGQRLD